jgi:hypothetical protein
MRICIRCDVLKKDEDVMVGRGINGGSGELEGGAMVYLYNMETFALAMLVHYTASRSCTIAVSEGGCGCGFDAGCSLT